MEALLQTYFGDILHKISQALLIPTVIMLILLILYGIWCIGSILVEGVTERRKFKIVMPAFLDKITNAPEAELPGVIKQSGLLGSQKFALLTLWDYRSLPVDSHIALAKRMLSEEEDRNMRVLARTQTVSKIAPMLGLMGTLIPLGPGLIALGVRDTATLSSSLLVAFDTTVAGLIVALVTYVVTKIRSRWYENYMSALEASTTSILEKTDGLREQGRLFGTRPGNTAQEYAKYAHSGSGKSAKAKKQNGAGKVQTFTVMQDAACTGGASGEYGTGWAGTSGAAGAYGADATGITGAQSRMGE